MIDSHLKLRGADSIVDCSPLHLGALLRCFAASARASAARQDIVVSDFFLPVRKAAAPSEKRRPWPGFPIKPIANFIDPRKADKFND